LEHKELTAGALWDLTRSRAGALLARYTYPWEALCDLGDFLVELGRSLDPDRFTEIAENVWVARTAHVAPSAFIAGPCVVDEEATVGHCAYIRGKALIGRGAACGNSTEVKNAILFEGVQLPHFNYCGDSILGVRAHMAAGAVTSNLKSDKTNVSVRLGTVRVETGLRKLGALLGDGVEIGCNAVLNPGTVIGRGTRVYPLSSVRGYIPAGCIYKDASHIVPQAEMEER